MSGLVAKDYPLHPFAECPDERAAGCVLLDCDDECKTTADPYIRGWRIVDWEVVDFDGAPHWFARSWHTISSQHVATLASIDAQP